MRKNTPFLVLLIVFIAIFGLTLAQTMADDSKVSGVLVSHRQWQQEEMIPAEDGLEVPDEPVTVYYEEKVYQVDQKY